MNMKYIFRAAALAALLSSLASKAAFADEFNRLPVRWKWLSPNEAAFSYDGSFRDEEAFIYNIRKGSFSYGVNCPDRLPSKPEAGADELNAHYSPDSSRIAFTRHNDLYVREVAGGRETRLTFDGSDLILNGYASWVYYEEIFGRASRYKAFWWSPDGSHLAFYRFDNSGVPYFPIYSPFGGGGSLNNTRYPMAGQENPKVKIGIIDMAEPEKIVWADFDENEDQYFGTPFWGPDGRELFVSREPRTQNTLDLYSVNAADGSKKAIYHEYYPTWLDWMDGVIFTDKGLYMARAFETGWQQIYFLSYDGKTLVRLTDGENWGIRLIALDRYRDELYFTANRHSTTRKTLYKLVSGGEIQTLTDPDYNVDRVSLSPDFKHFVATLDNARTPTRLLLFSSERLPEDASVRGKALERNRRRNAQLNQGVLLRDMAGEDYDPSRYCLPQEVSIVTEDGFRLPGLMTLPLDFDSTAVAKYPVHFEVYGGPDTPYVRDRWRTPGEAGRWFAENGIIHLVVDPRSAGHNGRAGEDMAYRQLTVWEIRDYVAWAEWARSLPYVRADRIGVEGFSFGGTTTVMLLCQAPEYFRCGIAGGGVYDWTLYDTHYTERFMDTPQNNPEGYRVASVLEWAKDYPVSYDGGEPSNMLKLTHGTGDDNVHFQSTLQLIDSFQKLDKRFELMIYPDGMHGYRGDQARHSMKSDQEFWTRYLLQ